MQLKEIRIRLNDQLSRTEMKKKEVNRLREEISKLKIMNSVITIGVPMNKIFGRGIYTPHPPAQIRLMCKIPLP